MAPQVQLRLILKQEKPMAQAFLRLQFVTWCDRNMH